MQPFGPNDFAQAQRLYAAADPNARALLDWFIAHPDQRADGATIAADLGFPDNRLVGRATYALGLAASEEGRSRPWHESQMGYLMTQEMAGLFARAKQENGL